MASIEEKMQKRIDSLLRYRGALDGSERELFDILINYANEVAMAIDERGMPVAGGGF
jgi:hypothetical protein